MPDLPDLPPPLVHLQAPARLYGTVQLPGSKSLTNRALVLAAQASHPVTLTYCSDSDDSAVVVSFLRQLGYGVVQSGTTWHISPPAQPLSADATYTVDLQLAGTAARFLTALCCTLPGTFVLQGQLRLHQRPIQSLVAALQSAGADIDYLIGPGHLPHRIVGNPDWAPTGIQLNASASSQFLTALLLLAPSLPTGFSLRLMGPSASESYVALTLALLTQAGIQWQPTPDGFLLSQPAISTTSLQLEADWSAASYLLGLTATIPGTLTLEGLHPQSPQPDAAQLSIFQSWGLDAHFSGSQLLLQNAGEVRIQPLSSDFSNTPDLAQTFAVLATWASAPTHITGLHTLPGKETDRLAALVAELASLGIRAVAGPDHLTVYPGIPAPTRPIRTYHDHRMAMAFSLLASRCPAGITTEDPAVVSKSFPAFWSVLASLGFQVTFSG